MYIINFASAWTLQTVSYLFYFFILFFFSYGKATDKKNIWEQSFRVIIGCSLPNIFLIVLIKGGLKLFEMSITKTT